MQYCLNRIGDPRLSFPEFAGLARRLGLEAIEIRNDVAASDIEQRLAASIAHLQNI